MCLPTEGRFMRIVVAVLSTLLTLMGCNERSKTTVVTRSSIDGVGVSATRATISDALAEFQCIKSRSGDCSYVLFLSDCPAPDPDSGRRAAPCSARPIGQFVLSAGKSKQIAGLPRGFRFCVGHGAKPVAPGCAE